MRAIVDFVRQYRRPAAAIGLAALCSGLAAIHAPDHLGISADELPSVQTTGSGTWVLDFIDPQTGEPGSEAEIEALAATLDAAPDVAVEKAGFYSEGEHLYRLTADPTAFARLESGLASNPLIEGIEPELFYSIPTTESFDVRTGRSDGEINKPGRFQPNDPMFALQWHMEQIRAPEAWTSQRGKGAVVAVIDTGVAWKNEAGGMLLPDLAGTSFVAGKSFVDGLPDGLDDHAHGSHVAGTIAQTTNNGIGVTGVAFDATIMPLKVLSAQGRGSVPGIANAIRYAADHGANVINMSLGGPLPSKVLAKAIEYAHEKGVITICAAGNDSRKRVGYPAAYEHSVAVSATNYDRDLSFYSNWGKEIDVAAPGGDTRSDKNGDGQPDGVLQNTIEIQQPTESRYKWFQGTSMAAPHAAGVAALIVGAGVTNPDEVERIMKQTAAHPQSVERDDRFGAGIVDAAAAAASAQDNYVGERGLLAGLLALFGLSSLGLAAVRRRWVHVLGFTAMAGWAAGLFGTPAAYAVATTGWFGIGSPLVFSAALPVLATILLLGIKPTRGWLAGLSLGYAALLVHGAVVLPTLLSGLPGGDLVDRAWLAANAVVALLLARRITSLRR